MGCHLGRDSAFSDVNGGGDPDSLDEVPVRHRRRGPDLSGLKLTRLSLSDLPTHSECKSTRVLVLRNNYLSELSQEVLSGFSCLQELYLDSNRFVSLPLSAISVLRTLTLLNLSNNPIRDFQGFELLINLRTLVLSMCGLRVLPEDVTKCPLLESVDLSFNEGISFPNNLALTVAGRRLSSISIASCALRGSELPMALRKLPLLSSVDVSDNAFDLPRSNSFFGNLKITSVKIRKLGLLSIPPCILALSLLEELDISENPLQELSRLSTFRYLRILNLASCELTTLPDSLEQLSGSLRELDISQNPRFCGTKVLSTLKQLVRLSIVGCLFCGNTDGRDVEWSCIAKLRQLRRIDWSDWSQGSTFNPYSTKLPIQLCGMPLENVNGLKLRHGLFARDFVATLQNILSDGFFKIDFLFEMSSLFHHIGTTKLLKPIGREYFSEDCAGRERFRARVKLSVFRYLFFLAFQSHNFDTPIIPPLDVVALHFSQMTVSPLVYRSDCMRIAGQILDCNYRMMVCEGTSNEANIELHRTTWNMVVDWQSKSSGRPLEWLRYDYCALDCSNVHGSNPFTVKSVKALANISGVLGGSATSATDSSDVHLDRLLPTEAAEYYRNCNFEVYQASLVEFFRSAEGFIRNEDHFESSGVELWARYARFLSLYSQERRLSNPSGNSASKDHLEGSNGVESKSSSIGLTKPSLHSGSTEHHHDADEMLPIMPPSVSVAESLDSSPGSAPLMLKPVPDLTPGAPASPFAVVPTLGMRLILYLHRSAPLKYTQCLEYLDINSATDDVIWISSRENIDHTSALWLSMFNENYLRNTSSTSEEYCGAQRSVDMEYNSSAVKKSTSRHRDHASSVTTTGSGKKVSIMSFDRMDV
jgi:Leucine-rich repeat (LRR) protein